MSVGATKSPICKLDPTAIPRLRPILFFIAINTAVECAKIPASQHKGEFKKISSSIFGAGCLHFLVRLNATSKYGSLFMFGLLYVLIIGLIVGAIAKLIVPGKEPGGCLVTIAIGVAGSFVAFSLGTLLGWTSGNPDSLRPVGFIPSLIGAVILLLVYHLIRRRFRR